MRKQGSFYILRFFLLFVILNFGTSAFSQPVIKGKVTNERGLPIAGATVSVKGSVYSVISDSAGNFDLAIQPPSGVYTISCTYKGYKSTEQRVDIGNAPIADLVLIMKDDVLNLDEVVVTGNAVNTTKKRLGNSISTIRGDDLKYASTSNLSGLLNGRIMGGVLTQNSGDPGGGYALKLRGVGSVTGSSEPLYIIDGIIVDNSSQNMLNLNLPASNTLYKTGNNRLIDINPHDVDRIEVINGPAAAAIYGSRAANGVVQIFTKRGKKGKPEVVYFGSINQNSLANKIQVNEYPFRFGLQSTPRLESRNELRPMIGNFRSDAATNPGGGPKVYSGYLDTTRYPVTRYDYQDQIFKPSWGTDQHISISGGGDNSSYYVSGSYLSNDGIIVGTGFKRYGLKFNSTYQLNDWIKLTAGLMFSTDKSTEKPNSSVQFSPLSAMNHTDNVYNIEDRDSLGHLKQVEYSWVNPLTPIETFDMTSETNRSIANVNINLTPWKGFVFSGTFGLDNYAQQGYAYQARMPYFVQLGNFPDGYVSASKMNYLQWTTELTASYSKQFNNSLSTSTVAGFSSQYIRTSFQAQQGRDLLTYGSGISSAQNLFTAPVDKRTEQLIYGYFLQETLGYKDFLYLTLAGRFDGSTAFGAYAGTIFYPKAGLAFTVSQLDFWQNSQIHSWFNTLQLRTSFGKAGNLTGIGPYDRFTTLAPINYYNNVGGFAPQNRRGNEEIRPEIKTEMEGGADMQFLDGRLFSKVTFYKQQINDIVIPYDWAPSNGYYAILSNLGSMENKGFEFMLGGYPVRTKNFSWEASLLLNKNKNKVTSLYQNAPFIPFENSNQGAVVGFPVGVYYSTYYARNTDGSLLLYADTGLNKQNIYYLPQVERGDPVTNTPSRDKGQPIGTPINKVLGDPNPDYTAHLVNEFNYKKWKLRIQFDRVAGFEMFNITRIIRNNIGNGKMAEKELKGELQRGWVAAVGGFVNGPVIWEEAVEDASFTKLRELSISYHLIGHRGIKDMEFILSGRNLYTFTKYEGTDPETNTAGQSIIRGTDYGSYPIPRVIQFTVIATF